VGTSSGRDTELRQHPARQSEVAYDQSGDFEHVAHVQIIRLFLPESAMVELLMHRGVSGEENGLFCRQFKGAQLELACCELCRIELILSKSCVHRHYHRVRIGGVCTIWLVGVATLQVC